LTNHRSQIKAEAKQKKLVTTQVKSSGDRLSLVYEQYSLDRAQLLEIPEFKLESRVVRTEHKKIKK